MSASDAIGTFLCLVAAIVMFFAAPIVLPVVGLLGVLLIIFGSLFSFGVLVTIIQAYK
jgi:hypothetical protein